MRSTMRPRALHIAGLLLAGTLAVLPGAEARNPFAFAVVYGDSFTDTHRMYAYRGQPGPPFYAPGRRCNGPVWPEYLSNSTQIELLNMAWEGAVTDQLVYENCKGTPFMNHTCRAQVDEYIASYAQGLPGTQLRPSNVTGNLSTLVGPDQRIVHMMACGIVDVQTSYNWQCWNKTNSTVLPRLIAESQFSMLRDLYDKTDARDFLVVNLFPVNETMTTADPPGAQRTMQIWIDEVNSRLESLAADFRRQRPDARIEIVDWWTAITRVYRNTSAAELQRWFGDEEVVVYGVCLKGDPNGAGIVQICDNPQKFFYFDGHFSTSAQHYLADWTLPYLAKLDADAVPTTASRSTATATRSTAASTAASTSASIAASTAASTATGATSTGRPSSSQRGGVPSTVWMILTGLIGALL
ncbi:hypothetical protein DFJ74DRAFT_649442 [Hyaloraphidium curvatum]|nr:hypothetical protein DFJ74DRAFT_649442 [Hyaloraphidium curvatum]